MMDKPNTTEGVVKGKWNSLYKVLHHGEDTKQILKEVLHDLCGRFLRREGRYLIFDGGVDGSDEAIIRVTKQRRKGKTPSGPYSVVDYLVEVKV